MESNCTTTDTEARARPLLTVGETAEYLGIGRAAAYRAVRRGEIPSIRIGRKVLVPTALLATLLGLTELTSAAK